MKGKGVGKEIGTLRRVTVAAPGWVSWPVSLLWHAVAALLAAWLLPARPPAEQDFVVSLRLRPPGFQPNAPPPPPPLEDPAPEERPGSGIPAEIAEVGGHAAVPESPAPVPVISAVGSLPVPAGILEGVSPLGAGGRSSGDTPSSAFRGRASRREAAERYGATEASEDAVDLGLRWLAAHQMEDGRWSTGRTTRCPPNDLCSAAGRRGEDIDAAMTGLALLAFLGAGHGPAEGEYRDSVRAGLRWLLGRQRSSGHFTEPRGGNMYVHGICSLAIAEACAAAGDDELRAALGRAAAATGGSQLPGGGWDYDPSPAGKGGEMTLSVWQMMFLRASGEAGVEVPEPSISRAKGFLMRMTDPLGAVLYVPGGRATVGSTGAGLFAKCMLGMAERGDVDRGMEVLRKMSEGLEPGPGLALPRPPLYAWYYRTMVEFHRQGRGWRAWNRALRPYLVSAQLTRGHAAGSWSISDRPEFGRVYSTALCLLMLEVYYRYPPASVRTPRNVIEDTVDAADEGPAASEIARVERRRPPDPAALEERMRRERGEAVLMLRSDRPEDRFLGARKLAELGDAGAVRDMIRAAERQTGGLKALHVSYVGRLKSPEAVPWLIGLLDDPDDRVRSAALSALVLTTGLRFPDASRWREWHASRCAAGTPP